MHDVKVTRTADGLEEVGDFDTDAPAPRGKVKAKKLKAKVKSKKRHLRVVK